MNKNMKIITVTGLLVIALGAYIFAANRETDTTNKVGSEDIKQLVSDISTGNIKPVSASINFEQLNVTNNEDSKLNYALPDDEFFVSIAPYVKDTHPCAIHNLATCRGELSGEEFSVYIEDFEGNIVIDQTMKSQPNGFIDLWLPRDTKYRITVTHNGKMAKSEFSTFDNDNTCITTLQLI